MPELARELLTRMATGALPGKLDIKLGEKGAWNFTFA